MWILKLGLYIPLQWGCLHVCHLSIHLSTFSFKGLLKNGCRDLLQTRHKCSLWGPVQVLLLFKWIRNPIWLPWPLIDWHIFKFVLNGLRDLATPILTKCCYFLSGSKIQYGCMPWPLIGWHARSWSSVRHFVFKFLSRIYKYNTF